MADAHKNFALSTIATAPSPADTGTSLVVATGEGALFPAAPFNATIWPVASNPSATNAEIVRVTAISADTLTITRTQESSSARTIIVGDQIAATITAKLFTDIEDGDLADVPSTIEDLQDLRQTVRLLIWTLAKHGIELPNELLNEANSL